jgi:hypothetical protein
MWSTSCRIAWQPFSRFQQSRNRLNSATRKRTTKGPKNTNEVSRLPFVPFVVLRRASSGFPPLPVGDRFTVFPFLYRPAPPLPAHGATGAPSDFMA